MVLEDLTEDKILKLQQLAKEADKILKEELKKANMDYDKEKTEVRIINIKSVGIQGDKRTYSYPAEITIYPHTIYNNVEFIGALSSRITNEIGEINRVVLNFYQ